MCVLLPAEEERKESSSLTLYPPASLPYREYMYLRKRVKSCSFLAKMSHPLQKNVRCGCGHGIFCIVFCEDFIFLSETEHKQRGQRAEGDPDPR